jgi:hypothetical protein
MIDSTAIDHVIGSTAYDRDGDRLGKVGQVYVDSTSGRPMWASIHTGLFGLDESLVPLNDATWDGDELRVPYEKDLITDAPRIESHREIEAQEQQRLWEYYGLNSSGSGVSGDSRARSGMSGDSQLGSGRSDTRRADERMTSDDAAGRTHIFDELLGGGREESGLTGDDRDRGDRGIESHSLRRHELDGDRLGREEASREQVGREHVQGTDRDDVVADSSARKAEPTVVVNVVVNDDKAQSGSGGDPVERVRIEIDTSGDSQRISDDARTDRTKLGEK